MEAEVKEVIKEKEYVHDEDHDKEYASKGLAGTALGFGIGGAVLGAAALWGRRGGIGGGMPENVNINTVSDALSGRSGAPTAFGAYSRSCEAELALTNEMWGLKVNTLNQMYAHRDTDVAEKFGLYKSQVDGDFGNYKATRDLYDVMTDKLNNAAFGLYKGQRDLYDTLNERYSAKFCELDKKVYGMEIANLYQNKIIQMGMDEVRKDAYCYTDRKTCRAIYGVVGLPSSPTVSVLEGANPYGCNCRPQASVEQSA